MHERLEDPRDDLYFDPLDYFFDDYEQYVIGALEEQPSLENLDPTDRKTAEDIMRYVDWKYEEGFDESTLRDVGAYVTLLKIRDLPETDPGIIYDN